MPCPDLKPVTAVFILVLFIFSSVPVAVSSAVEVKLLPFRHEKADMFLHDEDVSLRPDEYLLRNGITMASLSKGYPGDTRSSGAGTRDPVTAGDETSDEMVIDFRKVADELWIGNRAEGYLYWYEGAEDGEEGFTGRRPWRYKRYEVLSGETKYLALICLIGAGSLYLMPESITKWDRDSMTFSTLAEKWVDNVNAAPVWDEDDMWINYIAHPYVGSAYYIMARHSGFGWKGAFLYSTLISTFMWEGGVESFGEVPSTQDLIVTPIAGAILGEMLLHGEERILRNGGTVLGSRMLGKVSLALIDPAGHLISALRSWSDWPSRIQAHTEFFYEPLSIYNAGYPTNQLADPDSRYGVRLVFTYQ